MSAMTTAMRKPGLWVRDGRARKSLSVAGKGLLADSGFSDTGGFAVGGAACVVCSIRLMIAFQILPDASFGVADGVGQFDFCQVMSIKTLNIAFMRRGNGFLRLHDFEIIGNSSAE